jgi:hypothetical protein
MSGTAREPSLERIKELLKTITAANGFQNTVQFVTRFPFTYDEVQKYGKLPAIIVMGGDERLERQTMGRTDMPLGHKGATYRFRMAAGLLVYLPGVAPPSLDADLEANPVDTARSTLIEDMLKVLGDDKGLAQTNVMLDIQSLTVHDFIDVPRETPMFGVSLEILHSFRQGEL